jgi:hypothetical protein
MGTVRGYRRGTWLLWVRHSTAERPSPLSGVQHPQEQSADGECAELALRALLSFIPVRARVGGVHVWGKELSVWQ